MRHIRAGASAGDWVDLAGSCQQLINVVAAMQTVALAHVAATEDVMRDDGTIEEEFRGLGHRRLDAPALVQDLLGLTASGATDRVATAVDLVTRHPAVVEAMAEGRLDAYRARIVAEELADATPEVCAEVIDRIGSRLGAEAGGALRRRTRRVLGSVDGDLVRHLAERARAERSLRRCAFAPGVDEWSAKVPVEASRTAWSVVDGLARRYVTDGKCRGIEQARADALMDLIHARATGQVTVHLTVPASEVAREGAAAEAARDDGADRGREPAAGAADLVPVTGFGMPGVTHVRASWVASVAGKPRTSPDGPTSVHVMACDDTTGALMSLPMSSRGRRQGRRDTAAPLAATVAGSSGRGRYRPPEWMIAFVRARDGQCRFPGCAVNARSCDVDHVIPWPVGATHPTNLVCLCRRHHRIKQRPRWRSRLDLDGTLVWTDPTGRQRTTLPLDLLQREHPTAPAGVAKEENAGSTAWCAGSKVPPVSDSRADRSGRDGAALPSVVEETFEHMTDSHLIDLACRTTHLTTRHRRALLTGQRVVVRGLERTSTRGSLTVEVSRVRDRLDADEEPLHGHPHPSRPTGAPPADDPPPF